MTNASVPKAERLRTAHALAVKEAVEDRYKHEHIDDDERLELRERILRHKAKTEKAGRPGTH